MPTNGQPSEDLCSQVEVMSTGSDSDYSSSTSSLSELETSPPLFSSTDKGDPCASEMVPCCLAKSSAQDYLANGRSDCGTPPCITAKRSDCKGNQLVGNRVPLRLLVPTMSGSEAQLAVSVATWRVLTERQRSKMSSRLISQWICDADREVRAMGWQKETILSIPHLVMLHSLLRRIITPRPESLTRTEDVRSLVLVVLYIVCSYAGQEISYPYRPFKTTSTNLFWSRCIPTACAVSSELLRLTTNRAHFDTEYEHLRQAGQETIRLAESTQTRTMTSVYDHQKNNWLKLKHKVSLPCCQVAY